MSRRRKIALTALVWLTAAGLCVLPQAWPAFAHLVTNSVARIYEWEFTGFVLGWTAKDALGRRRRRRPETG